MYSHSCWTPPNNNCCKTWCTPCKPQQTCRKEHFCIGVSPIAASTPTKPKYKPKPKPNDSDEDQFELLVLSTPLKSNNPSPSENTQSCVCPKTLDPSTNEPKSCSCKRALDTKEPLSQNNTPKNDSESPSGSPRSSSYKRGLSPSSKEPLSQYNTLKNDSVSSSPSPQSCPCTRGLSCSSKKPLSQNTTLKNDSVTSSGSPQSCPCKRGLSPSSKEPLSQYTTPKNDGVSSSGSSYQSYASKGGLSPISKEPLLSPYATHAGKRKLSRPSSADSAKSAPSGARSPPIRSSSRSTSSDSKVVKRKAKSKTTKHSEKAAKLDPQSIEQLKNDLHLIKEQLLLLTKNRNDALELTNELQSRYADLLRKNQDQERQIDDLKRQNENLLNKVTDQQETPNSPCFEEVVETKKNLDQYENKLNTLYQELVSSSKILEESRNNVCRCIQEKNEEFRNILTSTKRLSQTLEDKSGEYEDLMQRYKKVKDSEERLSKEKEELSLTVQNLEDKLNASVQELEKLRKESAGYDRKKMAELEKMNVCYACQLEVKKQEVDKLCSSMKLLKSQNGDNKRLESEYAKLKNEYEELLKKMKIFQEANNQRFQELQRLKANEKQHLAQLAKLQNYSNELTEINNRQRLTITQLETMMEEQECTIQRIKADMASKEKQVEILVKSEDRLKKRTIELQEQMVSMKICRNQCGDDKEKNVLTIEESSLHITNELQDLITALYEEIDKTMAKDEQIQQLNRRICCLQCSLTNKDRELVTIKNELKMLREQFALVLKEKAVSARHMNMQKQTRLEQVCDMDDCECDLL